MVSKIKYVLAFILVNLSEAATYVPKPVVKNSLSDLVLALKSVVQQLCFVYGIGMVIIGLYKFKLNRECAEANPMGRVFSTVAAGISLIGVSFLSVPTVAIY